MGQARNADFLPGRAPDAAPPDMRDVMQETAERDKETAKEQKQSRSARHVKEAHAMAREAEMRLRTARLSTSTEAAIRHDLDRVVQLCDDLKFEAEKGLQTLGRK